MKQNITKKQWDELELSDKVKFTKNIENLVLPNIGQLIEYLGDDLIQVNHVGSNGWGVKNKYSKFNYEFNKELIDALWSACKSKLYDQEKM